MNIIKGFSLGICFAVLSFSVALASNGTSTAEVKQNLFEAIQSIDYVSLNILLAGGADVDTADKSGRTPLMLAAKIGNPRIFNILLVHSPALNKQDHSGATALMIAARYGQYHIAEKLVSRGAKIGLTDYKGNSALDLARKFGHSDIADLLQRSTRILSR